MIRYTLICDKNHAFESWFASAAAFDTLNGAGMVACSRCGSTKVHKGLMAPAVRPARKAAGADAAASGPMESGAMTGDPARPSYDSHRSAAAAGPGALSTPSTPLETALAALRRHLAENSDDVGADFAAEARAMHLGEAPQRAIHGEARADEARALIEEGVPVMPLPVLSPRRTN